MGQAIKSQQHGIIQCAEKGLVHAQIVGIFLLHRLHGGAAIRQESLVVGHRIDLKLPQRPGRIQCKFPGSNQGQCSGKQLTPPAGTAVPQPYQRQSCHQHPAGKCPAAAAVGFSPGNKHHRCQNQRYAGGCQHPIPVQGRDQRPCPRVSSQNTKRKLSR